MNISTDIALALLILALSVAVLTDSVGQDSQIDDINYELEKHYKFQWDINLDHEKRLDALE